YGTIGGNLTNSGTVEPGDQVGTLTVKGNYAQTSAGTLLVPVTPSASSRLAVGGSATLAGNVNFAFAPGTYVPRTYTFLQAAGGISGTFAYNSNADQGSVPSTLTRSVSYTTDAADLALAPAPVAPAPVPPAPVAP